MPLPEIVTFYDGDRVRAVDVVKVGRLFTSVKIAYGCDWAVRPVANHLLEPQPCGLCKGSGRVLCVTCKPCQGRGHSPQKNAAVERMVRAAQIGYALGHEAGRQKAERRQRTKKLEADVIDAPDSTYHVECTDCCHSPCICGRLEEE